MSNDSFWNSKALKYKRKYLLLRGGEPEKIFHINFDLTENNTNMIRCKIDSHGGEKETYKHYYSSQYISIYESKLETGTVDKTMEWCKENIKYNMENNIKDIYQTIYNLNPNEIIDYLRLAVKYNYKVELTLSNIMNKTDNKLMKIISDMDKINDPTIWIQKINESLL